MTDIRYLLLAEGFSADPHYGKTARGVLRYRRDDVVAILDSNSDPSGIAFPVPGNDDASRAIRLYTDAVAQAIGEGRAGNAAARGQDVGEMAEPPVEAALEA